MQGSGGSWRMDFRSVGRALSALFMSISRHRSTSAYSLPSTTRSLILSPLGSFQSRHFWDNQHPPSIDLSAPKSTGVKRFHLANAPSSRIDQFTLFLLTLLHKVQSLFAFVSSIEFFASSSFLNASVMRHGLVIHHMTLVISDKF